MATAITLDAPVIVMEDEPAVREQVVQALARGGFRPLVAADRRELLEALDDQEPAALILDLGLPGDDGMSIARSVRRRGDTPILMVTGRAGIQARVSGLDAGADDYLVKPFAPEELLARLRAVLRRAPRRESRAAAVAVAIGGARFDAASGELAGPAGRARLTTLEAGLLLALCRSGGPLSREAIYREVFRRDWHPDDRSVDVHVAHLRRKLRASCGATATIATLRGQGYELRADVRVETARP